MKIETTVETDLSYIDVLTKLKEDIDFDNCMPTADHEKLKNLSRNSLTCFGNILTK